MPHTVTISSKHQIVIPSEAREKLHLGSGNKLLVLCKDDRIVLIPKPTDFVERMKGLHKDIWSDTDVRTYLQTERDSWPC